MVMDCLHSGPHVLILSVVAAIDACPFRIWVESYGVDKFTG